VGLPVAAGYCVGITVAVAVGVERGGRVLPTSAIAYELSAIRFFHPQGRGAGVGRALGVGSDLGVGVGLGVAVGVEVGVAVGVTVAVGVAVAVGVGVGVTVGEAVGVGVGVAPCPPGNTRT